EELTMAVDVRAAILSIHYRAYAESHGLTPPPDMTSLEDAAGALRNAAPKSGRDESRRRHAIARLAAGGVDQYEATLMMLGAPIAEIRAALEAHPELDEPHGQMLV